MSATATSPSASTSFLEDAVNRARTRARARVALLRRKYPGEGRAGLARRLVRTFSVRAGLGGAATGALSLVSLPIGLPAGIALTLGTEAELLLALLEVYGLDTTGDSGRLRLYVLWAGGAFADVAKSVGLVLGAGAVARALAGTLPARVVARLNPALVRFVLKRLGLGWMPKALKLWPVLGAPIGYAIDAAALRALGREATRMLESSTAMERRAADEDRVQPCG